MFEYFVGAVNYNGEVVVGGKYTDINVLGKAGWELVAVSTVENKWGNVTLAFFKRFHDPVLNNYEEPL